PSGSWCGRVARPFRHHRSLALDVYSCGVLCRRDGSLGLTAVRERLPSWASPFTPTSLRNAHKSLEQFSDISAKRGECGAPGLFRRGEAPVSREGGPYRE